MHPLLLAAAMTLSAADAPIVLPLHHVPGTRMRTISVVAGSDTLEFLFDTGGGVTAIGPDVAPRVGCVPNGRKVGWRMTGEQLDGPFCDAVPLAVGPMRLQTEAGVIDFKKMMGPNAPDVHGMLSLQSFAGHTVTVDLAHERLVIETPESASERVRGMTPLLARLSTGQGGGMLDLFVGARTAEKTLWLELDSGHNAPTFVAPHAMRLLGVADSVRGTDVAFPLADGLSIHLPVERHTIIYDGVLNAATVERATWTIDLHEGRAWVAAVAPLLEPAPAAAAPEPPARDPVGSYEFTVTVQGHEEPGVLLVERKDGALAGRVRSRGEDRIFVLRDVHFQDGRLTFGIPMRELVSVTLDFDGLSGVGSWHEGGDKSGAARAIKTS